jgi:hypothetical protein
LYGSFFFLDAGGRTGYFALHGFAVFPRTLHPRRPDFKHEPEVEEFQTGRRDRVDRRIQPGGDLGVRACGADIPEIVRYRPLSSGEIPTNGILQQES